MIGLLYILYVKKKIKITYRIKVMLTDVNGAEIRRFVNTVQLQLWEKS